MEANSAVDKFRFCYGLSASADGQLFPWVFNPPDTYWDGASAFIRHVADVEGSFAKLKGKTIGLVYLDAPYGKEPIPLLQALANDYGYTRDAAPGLHQPSVQNQITGVKSRYGIEAQNYLGRDGRSRGGMRTSRSATQL